jgi:ribosomal protein L7/L12
MVRIDVIGWKPGFRSISFIKLMRNAGGVERGLKEAKDLVDEMIGGHPFVVQFENEQEADLFVTAANELGATVSRRS